MLNFVIGRKLRRMLKVICATNSRQPQCDVCDMNDVQKRHPIEFAIDGTPKWWQSPSLANGLEYERVNITIDLRQVCFCFAFYEWNSFKIAPLTCLNATAL